MIGNMQGSLTVSTEDLVKMIDLFGERTPAKLVFGDLEIDFDFYIRELKYYRKDMVHGDQKEVKFDMVQVIKLKIDD